jgi:putative cell wall-binding protein
MDLVIDNDTHALRQAIETTQDELRAAVLDGNAERLIELDSRMRVLSARLFGSDVSDTKKMIDKSEREKISIGKELEILREIKKQKNFAAGRAQELLRARIEKVSRAEFQVQLAENRLESARVTSRESKAKLQKLLDAKQKEQASAYERYELSKY